MKRVFGSKGLWPLWALLAATALLTGCAQRYTPMTSCHQGQCTRSPDPYETPVWDTVWQTAGEGAKTIFMNQFLSVF